MSFPLTTCESPSFRGLRAEGGSGMGALNPKLNMLILKTNPEPRTLSPTPKSSTLNPTKPKS